MYSVNSVYRIVCTPYTLYTLFNVCNICIVCTVYIVQCTEDDVFSFYPSPYLLILNVVVENNFDNFKLHC